MKQTQSAAKSTTPRRSGQATRADIIEVATNLFYERGFHGTSMRDIADRIGIRPASIYNHVQSKEDLLHEVALGSIQELLSGGQAVLAQHTTAADRLDAFVRAHVLYHARYRHRAKVSDDQLHALSPEHLTEVLGVRDAYEGILKRILTQGKAEGGWQIADVPVVAFAIATMCTAVGIWFREGGRVTAEQVATIYSELALKAVQGQGELPH
ncbi:TetR/AcrR family transcriptional regulator [Streptomyces sp. NPDC056390]|uniref:TetR/AcrR family transcriptional regulator n=1 Tax=Streptomyces sp. NPDC056390 TaxID=3345806 RepID=UPI0035E21A3B